IRRCTEEIGVPVARRGDIVGPEVQGRESAQSRAGHGCRLPVSSRGTHASWGYRQSRTRCYPIPGTMRRMLRRLVGSAVTSRPAGRTLAHQATRPHSDAMDADGLARPATARANRLTLAAMCMSQAMILLDVTIVNVALPSIQQELHVLPANLEWV